MRAISMRKVVVVGAALVAAIAFAAPSFIVMGYTTLGGSLGIATGGNGFQRDFRIYNNFSDATANNNRTADSLYPGALGAAQAVWKAGAAWNSNVLPGGGANFDFDWQGAATSAGGTNDNIVSEGGGCGGGGVLAFTETPISDGWRIIFCPEWNWEDGPGGPGGGSIDIQGVGCHELGHALGLGHSQSGNCDSSCDLAQPTMCAFICNRGFEERTPATDDSNGVRAVYGAKPADKPLITGLSGSFQTGQTLVITGTNLDATLNVKFTAGTGQNTGTIPGVVYGATSSAGGTQISVTIPASARSGNVLVWEPGHAGGARLSNPFPILINVPPPTITGISPTSGPQKGGTSVDISGTGFTADALVTFGGLSAPITNVTDNLITVTTPHFDVVGVALDVTVDEASGSVTLPAAFTVDPNPAQVTWTGTARVGSDVTISVFGPPDSDVAVAVGTQGSLTKAGFTFCFMKPIKFGKSFRDGLNTGADGQVDTVWVASGSAFESFNIQGLVRDPSSALSQTNCDTITIFP